MLISLLKQQTCTNVLKMNSGIEQKKNPKAWLLFFCRNKQVNHTYLKTRSDEFFFPSSHPLTYPPLCTHAHTQTHKHIYNIYHVRMFLFPFNTETWQTVKWSSVSKQLGPNKRFTYPDVYQSLILKKLGDRQDANFHIYRNIIPGVFTKPHF